MAPDVRDEFTAIREQLGQVIVGYERVVDDFLLAVAARGHVLLEGVPGVAKTTLARSFANVLGTEFHRIQFTQDLLPADITGHYYFNQKTREFELRKGAIFSDIVLADEINRAPPKTQSALLEAMEERQVTIEGSTMPLPDDFMVVATMNPVDLEGVYRLPEAQLDRFLVRSRMGYLPPELERRMLKGKLSAPPKLGPVVRPGFALRARLALEHVSVHDDVLDYAHRVGLRTREDARVVLGASPRAIERLVAVSRAKALLEGRDFVVPDDVVDVAPRVLNHRIMLSADAELSGASAERIVEDIVRSTPAPTIMPKA